MCPELSNTYLDPLTLITNALEGQFLMYAGRDEEAIARLQKTLALAPDFWTAHNVLGRVYLRQGRYAEAIAELSTAKQLSGGSTEPLMQLGYALAKAGESAKARATLAELESLTAERQVPAYTFAMIYNGLGETHKALNYLEKSLQEREVQITFIKIDMRWDNLRADPRFQTLLQGVGFIS
ncbi:MAG: tetratricopeptide repeat protein [Blastocatellia bacterium]|nr:tetratricopeptide repeat protein [Blastocatellia bacterium]